MRCSRCILKSRCSIHRGRIVECQQIREVVDVVIRLAQDPVAVQCTHDAYGLGQQPVGLPDHLVALLRAPLAPGSPNGTVHKSAIMRSRSALPILLGQAGHVRLLDGIETRGRIPLGIQHPQSLQNGRAIRRPLRVVRQGQSHRQEAPGGPYTVVPLRPCDRSGRWAPPPRPAVFRSASAGAERHAWMRSTSPIADDQCPMWQGPAGPAAPGLP